MELLAERPTEMAPVATAWPLEQRRDEEAGGEAAPAGYGLGAALSRTESSPAGGAGEENSEEQCFICLEAVPRGKPSTNDSKVGSDRTIFPPRMGRSKHQL